jgi:GNAT superfamily N-acetyltransferase
MIREATPSDVSTIARLIRELAVYERAAEQAVATEEQLHTALFGPHPGAFALLAVEDGARDPLGAEGLGEGEVVGFALWYRSFSTWTGTQGVHLEDLFVVPAARGRGHGKLLLAALARICVDQAYGRLEWVVLDWNAPAIEFYHSLGARQVTGWQTYRLTGDDLRALAEHAPASYARTAYRDTAHSER